MEDNDERDHIEEGFACDEGKSDPKRSHMLISQPSVDLNRYIVDKFHPSSAKSKHAPFESIDLSLYKPFCKVFREVALMRSDNSTSRSRSANASGTDVLYNATFALLALPRQESGHTLEY
ncbi:hypothetical protein ACROYT_G014415 [Oculina patagonica]